jgi:hypothetical protein
MKTSRDCTCTLQELIETGGAPYKNTRNSWIMTCPHCNKQKLWIRKSDGCGVCWTCSRKYPGTRLYPILAQIYGLDINIIKSTLENQIQYQDDNTLEAMLERYGFNDDEIEFDGTPPPIDIPDRIVPLNHKLAWSGVIYLETRGVSFDIAQQYDIHFDVQQQRVVFPVILDGVWRGWQARLTYPSDMIRKIDTQGAVGGKCLLFQSRLDNAEHAVITEGPFDAIKCHLIGGNTATMGKTVSRDQIEIYKNSKVKNFYIGLDNDAWQEINDLVRKLDQTERNIYLLKTPDNRSDLGECTYEEVLESFHHAETLHYPDRMFFTVRTK